MKPLGPGPQLDLLFSFVGSRFLVTPNQQSQALVKRGLCTAEPDGTMARITPAGLRALADALEAGQIAITLPAKT